MNILRPLALSLCLLAVSGCASTTYEYHAGDRRVGDAFEQPLRDTGWMRENAPDVLIRAVEAPYALQSDYACSDFLNEIAALDLMLGPDLDVIDEQDEESSTDASGLLSGAIRGVVGLPYRSIIRRLSGAERRERTLRDAIFAGMVRRAFLKGVTRTVCAPVAVEDGGVTPAAPEAAPPDGSLDQLTHHS